MRRGGVFQFTEEFALYAAVCAGGFVFVFRAVPETKGKTLQEIEAVFHHQ